MEPLSGSAPCSGGREAIRGGGAWGGRGGRVGAQDLTEV